ncbi:MAG: hypothetical protein HY060_13810 [Proteobacteria bacterium]|nr:hypothetical protein [Pseudomonadota bacterium]
MSRNWCHYLAEPDGAARSKTVLAAHRRFMLTLFWLIAAVPALALLLR